MEEGSSGDLIDELFKGGVEMTVNLWMWGEGDRVALSMVGQKL